MVAQNYLQKAKTWNAKARFSLSKPRFGTSTFMEKSQKSQTIPPVLLVDDEMYALQGYEMQLLGEGITNFISCQSGKEALDIVSSQEVSIILLDLRMPGMSGEEVLFVITEKYPQIPVVIITAVNEVKTAVRCMKSGAYDYIVKPVIMEELAARVKTHVDFYRTRKKMEAFALQMEKLAEERAKQLMHADRLATIGTLFAGLAHEIKNPATFITGNIQTLERFWPIIKEVLTGSLDRHEDKKAQIQFISSEFPKALDGAKDGVVRIRKVIDSLKAFSHKGSQEKTPFVVQKSIATALLLCRKMLESRVTVEEELLEEDVYVLGDAQQIEQVLVNLFVNASDAMEGQKDARIIIQMEKDDTHVRIFIKDNGPGIPEEQFGEIWEPFFTTKPAGKGTGLGLSLCRTMIEGHQGTLEADRPPEGGLCFMITLPIYNKE